MIFIHQDEIKSEETDMTVSQQRMQVLRDASKRPVTKESSRRALTKCGVLTKSGKVAAPYKGLVEAKKK